MLLIVTTSFDLAEILLRIIEKSMSKQTTRRRFSKLVMQKTLKLQKNRCKICKNKLKVCDFDHADGDSSNNSLSNCQALCLECHRKKNQGIKQKNLKLSQIIRSLKAFLKDWD